MTFSITEATIDAEALRSRLSNNSAGAFLAFEGRVRNNNEGKDVEALEYEAYKSMAEKEGQKIMEAAKEKFELIDALAVHRIGCLELGDIAVWVGVLSGHRDGAYQASRYIIDELKKHVPIWKKEQYAEGSSGWPANKD